MGEKDKDVGTKIAYMLDEPSPPKPPERPSPADTLHPVRLIWEFWLPEV